MNVTLLSEKAAENREAIRRIHTLMSNRKLIIYVDSADEVNVGDQFRARRAKLRRFSKKKALKHSV